MTNLERDDGFGKHHIDGYTKLPLGPNEMNNTPMAFNSAYYIRNKVSQHHLGKLKNLTREKFGVNMG
jgi:hypothetical protein